MFQINMKEKSKDTQDWKKQIEPVNAENTLSTIQ